LPKSQKIKLKITFLLPGQINFRHLLPESPCGNECVERTFYPLPATRQSMNFFYSLRAHNSIAGLFAGLLFTTLCYQCRPEAAPGPAGFQLRTPAETGVLFANAIQESDTFSIFNYMYIYNGAGVGVADFDGDGRQDLFFAGNQVGSRLYLNRGNWIFEDLTEAAGVSTRAWCTGVSITDINQDGLPDIYVCTANPPYPSRKKPNANLLFVNQGRSPQTKQPIFREMAAEWGLADTSYCTQAAWLDYDADGDLDMYLLNNSLEKIDRNAIRPVRRDGSAPSTDRLYRNDGNPATGGKGFVNVSRQAGIQTEGWGLGVCVNDFNADGRPDIYVANDFISSDFLWENNGIGTFTNRIGDYCRHESNNGMGLDVADLNADGRPDIVELDMLPNDNLRQKTMFGKTGKERFRLMTEAGYEPQYVRNSLQLNMGFVPDALAPGGKKTAIFAEIGQLAEVYKTDWSWTPLLADIDNDGLRDLLITNGYRRDITDLDFITYTREEGVFGTPEAIATRMKAAAAKLPGVYKHNYVFLNQGEARFKDVSAAWGFQQPSYSNGTVFADLDNDGDLDVVSNNIQDPAFLHENKAPAAHYLRVQLKGKPGNREGLGATLTLSNPNHRAADLSQTHYHTTVRGYGSSVEPFAHFGLGKNTLARLHLRWPDGREQTLESVAADQVITMDWKESARPQKGASAAKNPLFMPFEAINALQVRHRENEFDDFDRDFLVPQQYSRRGPPLSTGDVNGDGLEDVVMGGAAGQAAQLLLQQPGGRFKVQEICGEHRDQEDAGVLLFDADGDGDLDLYAASGGNERLAGSEFYRHRFYRNNGYGAFGYEVSALPDLRGSAGSVAAADADKDGDLDLFVGGYCQPGSWPEAGESYLLRNEGGQRFADVTDEWAPGLRRAGMIRSGIWADADGDGQPDLLLAGEWTGPQWWRNTGGHLQNVSNRAGLEAHSGWWNSLAATDLDGDGDLDFALGNQGWNTRYKASPEQPLRVYRNDFDSNGKPESVMTYYIEGREYPYPFRDQLINQILAMRRRFKQYKEYGAADFEQVFPVNSRKNMTVFECRNLASGWLENRVGQAWVFHAFPTLAQIAPIYGIGKGDFNGDGHTDLLLTGNSYAPDAQTGRYDAGSGQVLLNDGRGNFKVLLPEESGFYAPYDQKSLVSVRVGSRQLWLAAANDDFLRGFVLQQK